MTQPIDRNRLIEEAKEFVAKNVQGEILGNNRTLREMSQMLADFTLSQLKIERQRIAKDLRKKVKASPFLVRSFALARYIEKLEEKHDGE